MDINDRSKGIEFETDSYKAVKFYNQTDAPKMVRLVMKFSGLKEERQAEYVLLGFVVVTILISLFLFFKLSAGNTQTPDKDAKAKFEQMHPGLIYR